MIQPDIFRILVPPLLAGTIVIGGAGGARSAGSYSLKTAFSPSESLVWSKIRKEALVCTVERKSSCDHGLCKPAVLSTWAYVDLKEGEYGVCDRRTCTVETFPPAAMKSGRIQSERFGWTASFSPNGAFEEVRGRGPEVIVSSGICRPK